MALRPSSRNYATKLSVSTGVKFFIIFIALIVLFNIFKSGPDYCLEQIHFRAPAWHEIFDSPEISPYDPRVLRYLHMYRLFPPPSPPPSSEEIAARKKLSKRTTMSKLQELIKANNGGFFIECGANDGEFLSSTLQLEKEFGWTGLLIEASPSLFKKLAARGRNAWTANVCLSGKIEKNEFKMNLDISKNWMQGTGVINPGKKYKKPLYDSYGLDIEKFASEGVIDCFPLQSLLAAIGRHTVDFLTLDTQGHEFQILTGIPFQELDIKVLVVEYNIAPDGKEAIRNLMEENGYKVVDDNGIDFTFQKLYS